MDNISQSNSPAVGINLENDPVYCDFYKTLFIEELLLYTNPINLHYGNCRVFGKFFYDENSKEFYLKRTIFPKLDMPMLPEKYSNLPVKIDNVNKEKLPLNKYVVIFGEISLIGLDDNENCTTKDLYNILRRTKNENLSSKLNEFQEKLQTVLIYHDFQEVTDPFNHFFIQMKLRQVLKNSNAYKHQ